MSGVFFLPSTISEKQYKVLEEHLNYFGQYDCLLMMGGCELKDIRETGDRCIEEFIEGSGFEEYLKEQIRNFTRGKHK